MRLVLLGAPRPPGQNKWKNDLADGAEALGWSVVHLEAKNADPDHVVRLCRDADCFIWARTHRSDPQGRAGPLLRRIEDLGVPTVGVHMDLYWSLSHREALIGRHPWWTCQHVFTADGGVRDWAGRGVNHRWLPPAVSPRAIGRAVPSGKFPHPVVFVGDCVPRIHGPHRRALLDWAARRYGDGFYRFGRHHPVWGEQFAQVCATAGVVLGDSAPAPFYWSDRLVLTLSRGGLLAHPRTDGMAQWGFGDDTLILFDRFRFDTLGERLDSLTVRERERITDNALTLVRERHTWAHRLEHIAEVVSGAGDHRVRRVDGEVGGLRTGDAAASAAG